MTGSIVGTIIAAAFAAAPAIQATPAAPDAGLVTRLQGTVAWRGSTRAQSAPVTAFMKLRAGDEVDVAAGSLVRVVYFASGREETWTGPAAFRVEEQAGKAKRGAAPGARLVDAATARGLRRIPGLVREAASARAGATLVRSGSTQVGGLELTDEEKAELAATRSTYDAQRRAAPADDVGPELAYLVALRDFQAFEQMKDVVAGALARDPGNEALKAMEIWLSAKKK